MNDMHSTTETLPPEPVRVLDAISYQAGAVVSRTMLRRPNGTLTLFAFDKYQEISEHTSTSDAFLHVLEGELEVTLQGKVLLLSAGEAILLPANQPHAVRSVTRCKMSLLMIRVLRLNLTHP